MSHVLVNMDDPAAGSLCRVLKIPEGPPGTTRAYAADPEVWGEILLARSPAFRTKLRRPIP